MNWWPAITLALLFVQAWLAFLYGKCYSIQVLAKNTELLKNYDNTSANLLHDAPEESKRKREIKQKIVKKLEHTTTFGVYIVTLDEKYLSQDERDIVLRRRQRWVQAWTQVWPDIPYKWSKTEKRGMGWGSFKGHKASLAAAEADQVDIAILMEDDAVPFNGTSWPSDLLRISKNWPEESSCLIVSHHLANVRHFSVIICMRN
jgi:hypothetical protein